MKTMIITTIFIMSFICVPFSQTIDSIKKSKEIDLNTIMKPTIIFPAMVSFQNQNYVIGVLQAAIDITAVVLPIVVIIGAKGDPLAPLAIPIGLGYGLTILAGNRLIGLPVNYFLTKEYNHGIKEGIKLEMEKGFIPNFLHRVPSRRYLGIYSSNLDDMIPFGLCFRIQRNTFIIHYGGGSGYGGMEVINVGEKYLWMNERASKDVGWEYMILNGKIFELSSGLKFTNSIRDYSWVLGEGNEIPEKTNVAYNSVSALVAANCYFTTHFYINIGLSIGYSINDYLEKHSSSWDNTYHYDDYNNQFLPWPELKLVYWF